MLVSVAWIGPAVLGGVDVLARARLEGEATIPWRQALFQSLDWFLYALLTPGVFALSRRFPLVRGRLGRRLPVHLAWSLAFCAAWAGGGTVLRALIQPELLEGGALRHFVGWLFITLPFGVAVYLAMVGAEHAIRYFAQAREHELQLARLSEQMVAARLAALQAQLNPHFLFNTLNTIAVLVRDGDRAGAGRMIELLSEVLRRTLSLHQANEVPLGEELELVKRYLAIEQERFSDRLRPHLEIAPDTLPAAIPSFALQHLVENAIRHGIAHRPEAGRLALTARRTGGMVELIVSDDGVGIDPSAEAPQGHGIANTRERLRALYGEGATLRVSSGPGGGAVATLRLPYRPMPLEPSDGTG